MTECLGSRAEFD